MINKTPFAFLASGEDNAGEKISQFDYLVTESEF
jgi:hypothetical protein